MIKIEELAEKILKFQCDTDWYNMYDDYGMPEINEEDRKNALETIITQLTQKPDEVINALNEIIEEYECSEDHTEIETNTYSEAQEIIREIEQYKEQSQEDEMEM